LGVYDIHGRLVKTLIEAIREGGDHVTTWDGKNSQGVQAASGVYFIRIAAGDVAKSRKILLVR
jgi:flagellar hook assembly protein FlgD